MKADSCQFFFIPQSTNKYLKPTKEDIKTFKKLKKKGATSHKCTKIFAHSSYWINGATGKRVSSKVSQNVLKKEIGIATKLGIKYLVLHAGSAKGFADDPYDPKNKIAGIKAFGKLINAVLKSETSVTLLIENTAHGNKSICSDLQDFILLKSTIEKTVLRNVKFCLDTSHAFAYGYNLKETDLFVELVDKTIGIKNIKLIHLNDSKKPCGSKIDQHEIPGKGFIGKKVLQKFINHPKITGIPLLIEPPAVPTNEMGRILKKIKEW